MATYDLEEQEQIAELKAWWKQYGNLVMEAVRQPGDDRGDHCFAGCHRLAGVELVSA